MTKRKRWAMSDLVTDEMVETAARTYHEAAPEAVAGSWDVSTPRIRERGLARARAALNAAAPMIAEVALQPVRDALANHPRCEEHLDGDVISCGWKTAVLDVQRALEARDG